MRKISRKLLFFIYKRFKVLWISLTIILLAIFSYINWHNNMRSSFSQLNKVASALSQQIDFFIAELFEDSSKIPTYTKSNVTCIDDFEPYLQHIVMNNPHISGLVIQDKQHKIICSTLPHNITFLIGMNKSQKIIGPLYIPMFRQPVYALQKKIANYKIEVIIMASVFENALALPESDIHSIELYDEKQKNSVITVKHELNSSWLYKKFIQSQSSFASQKIFATIRLKNLDGVLITVLADEQRKINNFWYNQLLLCLDILVLSTFLYYLIKRSFNKYYSLHGAIKKAIKSKQFYPVYQPIFDAVTNSYSGVEVLLRWQGNHNEIIMPDFFIEEAEGTGLIVPITLQIIETAFQQTKSILDAMPTFHLSFNICATHFTDLHFFTQFYKLINQYSITPEQILFEITERDLLDENNKQYINKMHELRTAGYSLAVDDYGTGYSSISYLQYFPFNYLKIDKLFIHAIGTKAITETLNDAIINLAKKINVTIIAEGVETIEQVNYLLLNEVRFLQGWYFSKALSIAQLLELFKENKNE